MAFRGPSALKDAGTLRLFDSSRSDAGGFASILDPPHVDDVLLKCSRAASSRLSLAELASRPPRERWTLGEDWPVGDNSFTAQTSVPNPSPENPPDRGPAGEDTWRVHYERGRPLAIYENAPGEKPNIAVALTRGGSGNEVPTPRIIQEIDDCVWADIGGRVIVERGEYPRFETPPGVTLFNEPLIPLRDNLYRVGNSGYVLAASRTVELLSNRVTCSSSTWWMVAKERDAERVRRRVFTLKVYDGPYTYGARGTDIKLSDPVPLPSEADYAFYSYDAAGLRGLYRETQEGIAANKRALTISGGDLLERADRVSGDLYIEDGRVAGVGTLEYLLPVRATKLLNFYWRGDEVEGRLGTDGGPYTDFADYDGLAVTEVSLKLAVFNSLSSVRLEYEGISDWDPHGRPLVDVMPGAPSEGGAVVRIVGRTGEGLIQSVGLPTGDYTASANVGCARGRGVLGCGGLELVSWNPLDKSVRGAGAFVVGRGLYDILITGEAPSGVPSSVPSDSSPAGDSGTFELEVDRLRIAPGRDGGWLNGEIEFRIETEHESRDISESVNLPNVPAGTPESRRFRLSVTAPDELSSGDARSGLPSEIEYVSIATLQAELYGTGSRTHERTIRYRAEGPSRIHYPESLVLDRPPSSYYEVDNVGVIRWHLADLQNPSDVTLLVEGSPLAYRADEVDDFAEGYFYLPVELSSGPWRVQVLESEVAVSLSGKVVGRVSGEGLPFRVAVESAEDIRLETPAGLVQLRRGMGPRFEGFSLDYVNAPAYAVRGTSETVAFGRSEEEARSNLPFVGVEVRV